MNEVASFVTSSLSAMAILAGLACAFFLVKGGYEFITSAGSPENLDNAKKTIRNAFIGLVMVLGAATISSILSSATSTTQIPSTFTDFPKIEAVSAPTAGIGEIIMSAIDGFLTNIVETAVSPIAGGILDMLQKTPGIVTNDAIFHFWLFIVAITNSLFALIIALIGFQFMSATTFGFEELELKKILPRIGLGFLGANTSIFLIDSIIKLNDALVSVVINQTGGADKIITQFLPPVTAILFLNIIMLIFVILAIILLVFYITRLITIALGAVLSPIFFLLWTFPKFADFTEISTRVYLLTIFSTFVHAVILQLGAAFLVEGGDPFVSRLMAIGLVLVLLKSLPTMIQMSFYNSGKSLVKSTGSKLMNVINGINNRFETSSTRKSAAKVSRKVAKA